MLNIIVLTSYMQLFGGEDMAYFITDDCIACGVCQAVCPVECISEEGDIYKIDADECTDCGSCAEICPVGAPIAE